MKTERKELIDKFQRLLNTNPRKQILAALCANIAEEYCKNKIKKIKELNYE